MTARRTSIRRRVTRLVALGALVPLVGAAALGASDVRNIRDEMLASSALVASAAAEYGSADLAFEDHEAAQRTLERLGRIGEVEGAVFFDGRGQTFSTFRAPRLGGVTLPVAIDPAIPRRVALLEDHLEVFQPVVYRDVRYGTLYLRSATTPLRDRTRAYLWGIGLLMLGVLLSTFAVAVALERAVSRRILVLDAVARRLAEDEDYAVRVPTLGNADELDALADAFNQMLQEIERRQQDAREAVRVRDEFMSIASHELKTPLTALSLQAQSLQRRAAALPEDVTKRVDAMVRHVGALAHLIANLLDVSRIASGRLNLERSEMDLAALAREVAGRFEDAASRGGGALVIEAAEPVSGDWDAFRLEQVITNLVSNAIKYGAGRPVEVRVDGRGERDGDGRDERDEGRARLVVRDRGIGIALEDVDRIFGRYERAVSGRHYGGLGLGLYITNQIVVAHGGVIRVQSAPGEGSTFTVELPRRAQAPKLT